MTFSLAKPEMVMPDVGIHRMWCEWQAGHLFNLEIYNAISKLTNIAVQWTTNFCVLRWYFDVHVVWDENIIAGN